MVELLNGNAEQPEEVVLDVDLQKNNGMFIVQTDENLDNGLCPSFGNVHVESSNEVQIGNNTIYHGPVVINKVLTIKDIDDSVSKSLSPYVTNNVYHKQKPIENPGFVEDDCGVVKTAKLDDGLFIISNKPIDSRTFAKNIKQSQRTKIICQTSIGIGMTLSILFFLYLLFKSPKNGHRDNFWIEDSVEAESNHPLEGPNVTITNTRKLRIILRPEWIAQPPAQECPDLRLPVPYVIIHHTATENCTTRAQCVYQCRQIQTYHMESQKWWDIGYNFLIGGDGNVYEGRGFKKEGAHTYGYNSRSLGIGFIGTYNQIVPTKDMTRAARQLIKKAADMGILREDYQVFAARQLQPTLSPGDKLFEDIQTWDHWAQDPQEEK